MAVAGKKLDLIGDIKYCGETGDLLVFDGESWKFSQKTKQSRYMQLAATIAEQVEEDPEIAESWKNFLLFLKLRLPENSPELQTIETITEDL